MAIRIYGDSLEGLADASFRVADQLKQMPQVNAATVNPDIVLGKPYVEFDVDRETAARYGMSTMMVNQIIETALGGMNLTTDRRRTRAVSRFVCAISATCVSGSTSSPVCPSSPTRAKSCRSSCWPR